MQCSIKEYRRLWFVSRCTKFESWHEPGPTHGFPVKPDIWCACSSLERMVGFETIVEVHWDLLNYAHAKEVAGSNVHREQCKFWVVTKPKLQRYVSDVEENMALEGIVIPSHSDTH